MSEALSFFAGLIALGLVLALAVILAQHTASKPSLYASKHRAVFSMRKIQ